VDLCIGKVFVAMHQFVHVSICKFGYDSASEYMHCL
jgi:hypothetical protein